MDYRYGRPLSKVTRLEPTDPAIKEVLCYLLNKKTIDSCECQAFIAL